MRIAKWLGLFLLLPAALTAQQQRTVVPGADYAAGGLHRFFFGAHYRDLWTRRVTVEVLDLTTEAGGLTAIERGGGQQTRSLRLRAADGREFAFRSVQKDPSVLVPPELRGTVAHEIVQDQISSSHPAGALVVPPLLVAVGIPHATPRLVVLPDHPRLGEFRAEFAGMLGLLEERPSTDDDTGVAPGAVKVISSDALFRRVEESADDRVDAQALLTARLMDGFLGDWDRHRDQWRWVTYDSAPPRRWQPIPRDRDQAFVRFDGLLPALARSQAPQLVNFGPRYPAVIGLTWNGRELDRRFLIGLEWPAWDSTSRALQARLTDQVITEAVQRLPASHLERDSARLASALRARRDALPRLARDFYRLLAGEVEIHATDASDRVRVEPVGDHRLRVTITSRDGPPWFDRTFRGGETGEIRFYLHGGADSLLLAAGGTGGITLRAIGGRGHDTFVADPGAGGLRAYDTDSSSRLAGDLSLDTKPYTSAPRTGTALPPRDWGSQRLPVVWAGAGPDIGLLLGAGVRWTDFGFRQRPYASRHLLRAAYATGAREGKVEYRGEFLGENGGPRFLLAARGSGIETLRFHGFGNETRLNGSAEFYRVRQIELALEPALGVSLGAHTVVSAGPALRYTNTKNGRRFIDQVRPYGSDNFGMVSARATLRHDSRDVPGFPTRGLLVTAQAGYYPELWDVRRPFGRVEASLAGYRQLGGGSGPVVALRMGGARIFGEAPFQEAAYIGDPGTVRLGRENRFGGDAAVWGNAELRLPLGGYRLVVPGSWGILALGDVGRVFLDGETSTVWHAAYGGGIWFAPISRANTISVAFANTAERGRLYIQAGFGL